jgi:UDP-glucose 4-epimerase
MSNVLKGEELHVYGTDYDTLDGSCVRDYIHPEDLISAHMIALDNDTEGVYNLGSGIGYSVWQIVENLVSVTGRNLDVAHKPRRAGDPPILIANHEKFTKATGWEPTFTLKEIIATAWKAYGV